MNYFKVNCVGVSGKKIVKFEVECVQQRRLPYLHVIGGSSANASSLRERVLAAIESSGFRLPARRFTVSLGGAGLVPPEEIDLAVALAILGSSKMFPWARMGDFAVGGALSLDGRLLPLACRAPLRALTEEKTSTGLLLPWEDSHILGAEGAGGGFRTLAEVVEFLRGGKKRGPRNHSPEQMDREAYATWRWLQGRPLAQRLLPICAAGAHPLLLLGGEPLKPVAEDLYALLPPLEVAVREEVESLQRLAGEPRFLRPLREIRADQASRLLKFDSKAGIFGEISLAHGGLLSLQSLGDRPLALLRQLQEPLEMGAIRSFRGGRPILCPADWQLVARADFCPCGANEACRCASHEVQKWRQRLDQVRGFFPMIYRPEAARAGDCAPAAGDLKLKVAEARSAAMARLGKPNNRLGLEECLRLKPWEEGGLDVWRFSRSTSRSELALARVALTVSDLRGGEKVEKADVLEARYYVPEPFVPRARSGSHLWSGSVPSIKSSAIP
jgi:magnesium chelatase family protein